MHSAAGCKAAWWGASRAGLHTRPPQWPPGRQPHQTRCSRQSGTGSRRHRRLSRATRAPSSSWQGAGIRSGWPSSRSRSPGPSWHRLSYAEWTGDPPTWPQSRPDRCKGEGRQKALHQRPSPPLAISHHRALVPTARSLAARFSFPVLTRSPFLLLTRCPVVPSQTPLPLHLTLAGASPRGVVLTYSWSGTARPCGTRTRGKGSPECTMQSQAHHHPERPAATKAMRVEGLHQRGREPVACRLPVPAGTLGPSKVPRSGLVQVRGPWCVNKGMADAHRPSGPIPSPLLGICQVPCWLRQGLQYLSPLSHHRPGHSEHWAHMNGQNSPGSHARAPLLLSPRGSCLCPTLATAVGRPGPTQLFAQVA